MYYNYTKIDQAQIIKNKNNIKCNLDIDTGKFNMLMKKYNLYSMFKVICVLADTAGFGDVIFFTKFVKYLSRQYPNISLSIAITNKKRDFIKNILKPCKIYIGKETEIHPSGNKNIECYICDIIDDQFLKSEHIFEGDILFIAPKTNVKIKLKYLYPEKIKNNTYVLSEYNPTKKAMGNINTGLHKKADSLTGIHLNNYPETFNSEKELYSITYIYAEDAYMEEYAFKPSSITFQISKEENWDLRTLFYNLNFDTDELIFEDEYYENELQFTETHDFITKLKLCLSFREYLNDIVNFTNKKVKIYYRGESVDALKQFVDELSRKDIKILKLESLEHNLFSNDKLHFEKLPLKTYEEMRNLYEHSIPIIFISGDQSITDFLSVNKYKNSDDLSIYYQIFEWKQNFADSLGSKYFICFKMEKDTLDDIVTNPTFDFRYKGMLFIHSVLLYALKYKFDI